MHPQGHPVQAWGHKAVLDDLHQEVEHHGQGQQPQVGQRHRDHHQQQEQHRPHNRHQFRHGGKQTQGQRQLDAYRPVQQPERHPHHDRPHQLHADVGDDSHAGKSAHLPQVVAYWRGNQPPRGIGNSARAVEELEYRNRRRQQGDKLPDVALDEVGHILHRRDGGVVDGIAERRQARVHLLLDTLRHSLPVCFRYLGKRLVAFLDDPGRNLRDCGRAAHQRIRSYADDGQGYDDPQQRGNYRYHEPVESRPAARQGRPFPQPHHWDE